MVTTYQRLRFNLHRAEQRVRRIVRSGVGVGRPALDGDYSLRPFRETRSIFVHIPKTGGVSISRALYGGLGGGHTRITEYELRYSAADFADFFKFTVVRNPWSRLFSAFHFLKAGGFDARDREAAKLLASFDTFEAFVLDGVGDPRVMRLNHFVPQLEFITGSDGTIPLDFVGFFETLDRDFDHVRVRLNRADRLLHHNRTPGENGDYRLGYTPDMIARVASAYREDIAVLGYEFDNGSLPEQIRSRDAGLAGI
ncbi:sulfotransferase family 2 domain-containing protein [Sphingomonas sp.]|uniref:sulfotransferase family 2 domain-containing protein n=1 Tax=Sphingomonas sp. TaxID=28214 RepID=UPI001B046DC6|nr:sulfotransferase family 2 domain-containing protein [Sphingomonas sp.]MBO9713396.1 sulfotransferase family 2 domain-containing protein [Sphingomonas sp.]